MVRKKDEVLGALIVGRTIPQLCELLEGEDDLKVTSIIAELRIERKVCLKTEWKWDLREQGFAIVGVYYLTNKEQQNQLQILWNYFSSVLRNEIV